MSVTSGWQKWSITKDMPIASACQTGQDEAPGLTVKKPETEPTKGVFETEEEKAVKTPETVFPVF